MLDRENVKFMRLCWALLPLCRCARASGNIMRVRNGVDNFSYSCGGKWKAKAKIVLAICAAHIRKRIYLSHEIQCAAYLAIRFASIPSKTRARTHTLDTIYSRLLVRK